MQDDDFKILIDNKVTSPEFKEVLRRASDATLKRSRCFLIKYPTYNKTALNRIKTEIKRRIENPNRLKLNRNKDKQIKEDFNYMNQFFFIGNLTKDPELTETTNGVHVCRFALAVNRDYVDGEGNRKADFFNCVAWRSLAENVAKNVKKGNKVCVSGSIEVRDYEDSNGIKRKVHDYVAKKVEFLTAKTSKEDDAASKNLQPINDDTDIPF